MSKLIVKAITEHYGERCLDYAEGCPTCEAWAEYDRLNTRPAPAATDTGLVTVGWLWEYAQYRTDDRGYYGYETVITESNPTDHVSPAEKLRNVRELVTRQNAEEVIEAERMKLEATAKVGLQLSEQIEALEADNAALTARIAELEEHFAEMVRSCLAERDRNKVLEADNKRLREALEPFAKTALGYDDPDENGPWPDIQDVFVTLGDCRRACAALGKVKS